MENTSYKIASLDVLGFLDEMELSAMLNRNMIDVEDYAKTFQSVANAYARGFGFNDYEQAKEVWNLENELFNLEVY